MSFKTYNDFKGRLNEGLFDKLTAFYSAVATMFKDPMKAKKSIDAAVTEAGTTAAKFTPKMAKVNETFMVSMGDGKDPSMDFSIAFTKLADLPDGGSGLFQITGTTNMAMLKGLVGSENMLDLGKNNVMAIIATSGFEKGKVATMRIVKNILPGGKDYVTSSLVVGAVNATTVQEILSKQK